MSANRPTAYYRPELDAVRFLAFLLVFLHHVLPDGGDPRLSHLPAFALHIIDAITKACSFGLSLFFALSAFLICELLIRERRSAGIVNVKRFYFRRILRIWPLYYLGLVLGAFVAFMPGGHRADLLDMGWFAIFLGAWQIAIHGTLENPMNVLWSISVEEQFYLFAPWMVKYLNRRSLLWFCGVLIVLPNLWLVHLAHSMASDRRVWFDTFVHFECFAAGMLLCLVLNSRLPQFTSWTRRTFLAAAFACWFTATYELHVRFHGGVDPGSLRLMLGYALAAGGSVLVILAFLGVASRAIPAPIIYLGRISFGLYIFHDFAIYLCGMFLVGHRLSAAIPSHLIRIMISGSMDALLSLGLTILLAAMSYRFFESPFLNMKKRFTVIQSQPDLHVDSKFKEDFASV